MNNKLIILCLGLFIASQAFAQSPPTSGKCGDNVYWEITGDSLILSGKGKTFNYDFFKPNNPWSACTDKIRHIVIGNGITCLGANLFHGCVECLSVSIPKSVRTIMEDAFNNCRKLTNIPLPEGIRSIGYQAFAHCADLKSIVIPASVKKIEFNPFLFCKSINSIIVDPQNKQFDSRYGCNAIIRKKDNRLVTGCSNTVIPGSVTSIGTDAFCGCESLTSIRLPDGLKGIGFGAFSGAVNLKRIDIPPTVNFIGAFAFEDCTELQFVTLPAKLESIEIYTFRGASNLKQICIPTSVLSIHDFAFSDCTELKQVTIQNPNTFVSPFAFKNCNAEIVTAGQESGKHIKYYYCAYQPFSVTWQYDSAHVYRFGNDYVELRVNEPSVPQGMGYEQLLRLSFERPWRDKVIELTFEDGKVVAGNAWVTTDEFDYGRETAYLPGECVVPLSDIRHSADTLYFSLDFRNVTYFSDAVDVSIHSDKEALDSGYHEWVNNKPIHEYYEQGEDSVGYKACIYEDSVVVLTQLLLGPPEKSAREWTREAETFVGMSRNEVMKRDRHYPKEMEEKNRLEYWNK